MPLEAFRALPKHEQLRWRLFQQLYYRKQRLAHEAAREAPRADKRDFTDA